MLREDKENKMKDGKDVHIIRRSRKMGFDVFEGVVDGRKTSVDIPTQELEKMNDRSMNVFIKRSLRATHEYELEQKK